jgi:hypothetical protein
MRITFGLLTSMHRACEESGCRLLVVLIPTKETVFADLLLGNPTVHLREAIADLVANEREAVAKLRAFLDRSNIPYVDTLPALRGNIGGQIYALSDHDMHPSRNGYRAIGEAVAGFLGDKL